MGPPPNQNPGRTVIRDQLVLPDSRHWLGWNQYSIDDKARQTMIQMLTTAGDELIFINAPFDYRMDVGNDGDVKIWRDSYYWVANEYWEKIGYDGGAGNYDQKIENNRTEFVGGEYKLDVEKSRTTTIKEEDKLDVTKKRTVKVEGEGQFFEVQKLYDKKVFGNDVTNCFGGGFFVAADSKIIMQAPSIDLLYGRTTISGGLGEAAGGLELGKVGRIHHERNAVLESGPSKVDVKPESVEVRSASIDTRDKAGGAAVLANGSYTVDAPQGVTFKCGTNEIRMTPEGVYINGQQLVMTARRADLYTSSFNIVHPDEDQRDDD
jgi:hypothetical protein